MRFNFENALCFGKVLVTSCLALGVAITTRHGALERENEGNHGTELQPAFERKFSIKCLQFYLSSGLWILSFPFVFIVLNILRICNSPLLQ